MRQNTMKSTRFFAHSGDVNRIFRSAMVFLVVLTFCGAAFGAPRIYDASAQYRSATIGGSGDGFLGLRFCDNFDLNMFLSTYQSLEGYSSYDIAGGLGWKLPFSFPLKLSGKFGITNETIDLTDRHASPSLGSVSDLSKTVPHYSFGIVVDTFAFRGIHREPMEFFGGFVLGDFVSTEEAFSSIVAPEEISANVALFGELGTRYGRFGISRNMTSRNYFGENVWNLSYRTPPLVNGLMTAKIGWENKFAALAELEFKVRCSMFLTFGVDIPSESSMWTWRTGIEYRPKLAKSYKKRGDIEILAPKIRSIYD